MADPPHNLPQIQLGRQLGTWKPFTDFRSALEAGNISEALRLNSFLDLTQDTVVAHHALLLTWIKENKWWADPTDGYGPYDSWADCAQQLTNRGRSTCQALLLNWQWWRAKAQTAETWIRHCQLIGWTMCREIRLAQIPAAEIETVVQEVVNSALPREALRKMLAAYNPQYDPTPEPWTRFQVKCSADGRQQLEAIFDDLAKIAGIDRNEPGANDQLISLLHARWFQGQDKE